MSKNSISIACIFCCMAASASAQDFFDFKRFWPHAVPFAPAAESFPDEKSPSLKEEGEKKIIIPSVKGILLVGNVSEVKKSGLSDVKGLQVKDIEVPGGLKKLRKAIESKYLNKPLTQTKLLEIKRNLILYWRSKHHPIVTIEVPEQDVTEGVIQLVVIESRVGEVSSRGGRWFSNNLLRDYVELEPGDQIDADSLLSDIAWMNRNPFRRSDVIFSPGKEEGTTDVDIVTKDRFPFRAFAGGDNTGNRATGHTRLFGGFNWANFCYLDHTLSYQWTASPDMSKFQSHTVHYTAPLSWRNTLLVYGGYAMVRPHLSDVNDSVVEFKSRGKSAQGSLRYEIPVGKTYSGHLKELNFGFDFKYTNNNLIFLSQNEKPVDSHSVNISQLTGGFNWAIETNHHKFNLTADFYWSPGEIFPHQSDAAFESLQPGAKNKYVYGRLIVGDVYSLPCRFTLSALARLQAASVTLLPSEQFGIGGYGTVRGYEEREINEDNGVVLNMELRAPSFSLLKFFYKRKVNDELVLLGFVDWGFGMDYNALPDNPESAYLLGVGPGLRYTITPYLSVRVDLGFKMHKTRYDNGSDDKLHVGIVASY